MHARAGSHAERVLACERDGLLSSVRADAHGAHLGLPWAPPRQARSELQHHVIMPYTNDIRLYSAVMALLPVLAENILVLSQDSCLSECT